MDFDDRIDWCIGKILKSESHAPDVALGSFFDKPKGSFNKCSW